MSANKCAVYQVTTENATSMAGPAIHPRVDRAHVRDKTPDPMTEVMMCAVTVKEVPARTAQLNGAAINLQVQSCGRLVCLN